MIFRAIMIQLLASQIILLFNFVMLDTKYRSTESTCSHYFTIVLYSLSLSLHCANFMVYLSGCINLNTVFLFFNVSTGCLYCWLLSLVKTVFPI